MASWLSPLFNRSCIAPKSQKFVIQAFRRQNIKHASLPSSRQSNFPAFGVCIKQQKITLFCGLRFSHHTRKISKSNFCN